MGGGGSGRKYNTQGAKSVRIPTMGITNFGTTFALQNGTGFASFSGMGNIGGFGTNTERSQSKKIVEIVAALIWRKDKFLICQRPAHKSRALLWEFVGGKVEEGETKEQALIRECREKLAITVVPKNVCMEVKHEDSDIIVYVSGFTCAISNGEPQRLEHNAIKFITVKEINNYDFCTADKQILEKIKTIKFHRYGKGDKK